VQTMSMILTDSWCCWPTVADWSWQLGSRDCLPSQWEVCCVCCWWQDTSNLGLEEQSKQQNCGRS